MNVNPDGSTTFEGESTMPPAEDAGADGDFEETIEEVVKGTDPAIYLLVVVILLGVLYFIYLRKAKEDDDDEFFSSLDGEKVGGLMSCSDHSTHANRISPHIFFVI